MSFKILLLPPDVDASWPEKIRDRKAMQNHHRHEQDQLSTCSMHEHTPGQDGQEMGTQRQEIAWAPSLS